jgi:hypothetical protein
VDNTLNEAGSIKEVVDLVLRFKDHSERVPFAVTNLGKQDIILGFPWLSEHNPEVDWKTGEVKMSRCSQQCRTCFMAERQKKKGIKRKEEKLQVCRAGPMPEADVETRETIIQALEEWIEETEEGEIEKILGMTTSMDNQEEDAGEEVEEGDRIFYTALSPEDPGSIQTGNEEHIRAYATISTRLAEAWHKQNVTPKTIPELVPQYLHDFEDIFAKESFDSLPERRRWDHGIELVPGSNPSSCKIYPLSPNEQEELDRFLEEHLASGRIRPSKSPMASPFFFVKKKDGKLRPVQDYRKLNLVTVKNAYPLPLISDLINQLRGAHYFTKLDVRWGYNNVRIKEGDEWKAAFRTNRGLFEPLVMFFGLTNSPATFQTMMNEIFQDLIMDGVVSIYLDDILIFTKTLDEHRRITRLVLERLRQHHLYLKPEKCEFEKTQIEYLGLIISDGRVEMDPVKVEAVSRWPVPTNKKEVQSFLGFTNFYRRFIRDFSHHGCPLFDLTGSANWRWGDEQQEAFQKLKDAIISKPVLIFPDETRPFRVEADSSEFATGAILSQQSMEDEKWHPVAFLSKSLDTVQRNYEIYDKEMLAIIRALTEWRHFLEGTRHKFEIWTDHKNLEYFMTAKKLNRRQARWSLYLSRFDFSMHHRPGRSMGKADALSRRADHGNGSKDNEDVVLLDPGLFAIRAVEGLVVEGEEKDIMKQIRQRSREGRYEDKVTKAIKELKGGRGGTFRTAEWREENGLLFFRDRIYVPRDPELRRHIVEQHHDSRLTGHPGRWKTLELVSRNYWWPNMSQFIGQYCATCDLCLRTKVQQHRPLGELHPLPIPEERWKVVSVDFVVELPESNGYDAVMCVVESTTKRAHFISTHTTVSALGAARLYLHNVWKLHGLPSVVVSDRGGQFVAQFTRELYQLLGIKVAASTAYHPQTDGQTERLNQELEQYIRLFINERQSDWDDLIPMMEFQYNNHVHSSTQNTPFMLDTGRHPRMGFEPHSRVVMETANEFAERMRGSLEEAKAALAKAKDDMARYYNQRHDPTPEYQVGDKVYLDASDIKTTRPSKKLAHRNLGPFSITKRVGSHAYRLRLPRSLARLHPVFPVVKLTLAPPDPFGRHNKPPPLPELIEDEEHYEVEEVLDSRLYCGKLQYLVKWKGFGYEENSWIGENNVFAPRLTRKFHQTNPAAARQIQKIHFDSIFH